MHSHLNKPDVDGLISALKDISTNFEAVKVHESVHNSSLGASGALLDEDSSEDEHQPLYKRVLNDRDLVLDIRDCFAGESEIIPIGSALGRISCESKYACPPGFPVLLYGERIQESHIKLFSIIKEEGTVVKVMKQTHLVLPSSTD
jgi:arginine/lysine/ornithine decarboxylase